MADRCLFFVRMSQLGQSRGRRTVQVVAAGNITNGISCFENNLRTCDVLVLAVATVSHLGGQQRLLHMV